MTVVGSSVFYTDVDVVPGLSEQDQEVVADLDRHILEIERDLEVRKALRFCVAVCHGNQ